MGPCFLGGWGAESQEKKGSQRPGPPLPSSTPCVNDHLSGARKSGANRKGSGRCEGC